MLIFKFLDAYSIGDEIWIQGSVGVFILLVAECKFFFQFGEIMAESEK